MTLANSVRATLPVFGREVARGFVLGAKAILPQSERYMVMKMFLVYEWPAEEQARAREVLERAQEEVGYSREPIEPVDVKSMAQGLVLGSLVDRTAEDVPVAKIIEGSLRLVRFDDRVRAIATACRELADCHVLSIDNCSKPIAEWRITSRLRSDQA